MSVFLKYWIIFFGVLLLVIGLAEKGTVCVYIIAMLMSVWPVLSGLCGWVYFDITSNRNIAKS